MNMTSDDQVDEMRQAVRDFQNEKISEEEVRGYDDVDGFGRLFPVAQDKRTNPDLDLDAEANSITACLTDDTDE